MIPATQAAGYAHILSQLPACEREVWEYLHAHAFISRNELDRGLGNGRPNCQASRRLAAMERKGIVARGSRTRPCTVTGRMCETWWAVETSPRAVAKPVPLRKQLAALCAELHRIAEGQLLVAGQAVLAVARRFEQQPANTNAEGGK